MKISTKSRYGLRAIAYLAKTKKVCPINLIAREENISSNYLEKIFSKLKKADLVKAKRGKEGGYFLARPPQKISVGEILRALEGAMVSVFCIMEGGKNKYSCPRKKTCLTKNIWKKIQDTLDSTLDSITLTDLINETYD